MLGAELIGFHVAAWVEGFLDCCELIGANVDRKTGSVEHEGRRTWVREYPITIDHQQLRERAASAEATMWADRFEAAARGPLVVRADRTEPSKNIVRGFEAFGQVLDRRPDLSGSATFIACLYPSRQTMAEYRNETEEIKAAVERINARHPDSIDLYMKDDFDRTLGALEVYDVLLVNPLMDGMNLVAKEGPVVNRRGGVLVLSEGAGAFEEMGNAAIPIANARDVDETAHALETALNMTPEDRSVRAKELRALVESTHSEDWINAQLADLGALRDGDAPISPPLLQQR